jgi:fructose-bisphosphate aldolase class I
VRPFLSLRIVEPEALIDGDHDRSLLAGHRRVLKEVFQQLFYSCVAPERMVWTPNMAIAGKKSPTKASVGEVAETTIKLLKNCVPGAVPGVGRAGGRGGDRSP